MRHRSAIVFSATLWAACSSEVVDEGGGGGGAGGGGAGGEAAVASSVVSSSSSSSSGSAGGSGGAAGCLLLAEPQVLSLPGTFTRLSMHADAARLLIANGSEVRAFDTVATSPATLSSEVGLAWLGGDKAVAGSGTNLRSRIVEDIGNDQKSAGAQVVDVATFPGSAIANDVYYRATDRIHVTTWPAEPSTDPSDFFAVPAGAGNRLVAVRDGADRYLAWDVGTEVEVWTTSATPTVLGTTDLGLAPQEFVVHVPTGLVFGRQGQAFGAGLLNAQTLAPFPGAFARAVALEGDRLALAYTVGSTHSVSVCCVDESFASTFAGVQVPDGCATVEVPAIPLAMAFRTPDEIVLLLDGATQTDVARIPVELP